MPKGISLVNEKFDTKQLIIGNDDCFIIYKVRVRVMH